MHSHDHTCPTCSRQRLDELTYRELRSEVVPNSVPGQRTAKLPFRDWAPLLRAVEVQDNPDNNLRVADYGTMHFKVKGNKNEWDTFINFVEWDKLLNDSSFNAPEAARMALWVGNVRLHCNCPSFAFWGFQYILSQLDASIYYEDRFPVVRNPQLRGIACKHLIKTLTVLPAHSGDMARAIKQQRAALGLTADQ